MHYDSVDAIIYNIINIFLTFYDAMYSCAVRQVWIASAFEMQ